MNDYNLIKELDEKYGTPLYIFNKTKLEENFNNLESSFRKRYNKFIIGYSYKTNYLPYLCKILKDKGAYAEVVSRLEYDLALKIKQDPKKIIFNGPLKNYEDIEIALNKNSIINLDSFYEIVHLKKYAKKFPNKKIKIGLRVNIDLTRDEISPFSNNIKYSRFGFCVKNNSFKKAIDKIKGIKNIVISGLHCHTSTKDKSLWIYREITKTLCKLATNYINDTLEYIDIGGGFYSNIPKNLMKQMDIIKIPTFNEYSNVITNIMNSTDWKFSDKKPFLIIEPGFALTANVMEFITKVIDIKKVNKKNFVLVNGSILNVKPTLHKFNLPAKLIKKRSTIKKGIYDIVGYTCMEKDRLLTNFKCKNIDINDYLVIKNVGAYTIVMNPPFIKERPLILTKEYRKFKIIRQRENINDFFKTYNFGG